MTDHNDDTERIPREEIERLLAESVGEAVANALRPILDGTFASPEADESVKIETLRRGLLRACAELDRRIVQENEAANIRRQKDTNARPMWPTSARKGGSDELK